MPLDLGDTVNSLLFLQIWSVKYDVFLNDFRENSKASNFVFFVDSFNQIRHELLTNIFLLGYKYNQMESNCRWYEQSESPYDVCKVSNLLLRSY